MEEQRILAKERERREALERELESLRKKPKNPNPPPPVLMIAAPPKINVYNFDTTIEREAKAAAKYGDSSMIIAMLPSRPYITIFNADKSSEKKIILPSWSKYVEWYLKYKNASPFEEVLAEVAHKEAMDEFWRKNFIDNDHYRDCKIERCEQIIWRFSW